MLLLSTIGIVIALMNMCSVVFISAKSAETAETADLNKCASHHCIHDSLDVTRTDTHINYGGKHPHEKKHTHKHEHKQEEKEDEHLWQPIRIVPYFDDASIDLHSDTGTYLQQVLSAAISFIALFVKVHPIPKGQWSYPRKCTTSKTKSNETKCKEFSKAEKDLKCGEFVVPAHHFGGTVAGGGGLLWHEEQLDRSVTGLTPVDDIDLMLYVNMGSARCNTGAVLAFASMCVANQFGRPIAGRLTFCPIILDKEAKGDGKDSTKKGADVAEDADAESASTATTKSKCKDKGNWKMDVLTVLHELTHVLVFNEKLFAHFWDPRTGAKIPKENVVFSETVQQRNFESNGKGEGGEEGEGPMEDIRQTWVISPHVRKVAAEHFGDDSVKGVLLENVARKGMPTADSDSKKEEGKEQNEKEEQKKEVVGGHWKERVLNGEYMQSHIYNGMLAVSKFTMALMKDSGWYKIDYDYAEPFFWEKDSGKTEWKRGDCMHTIDKEQRAKNIQYHCHAKHDHGCKYDYTMPAGCIITENKKQTHFFADGMVGNERSDFCPFRNTRMDAKPCWDSNDDQANANGNGKAAADSGDVDDNSDDADAQQQLRLHSRCAVIATEKKNGKEGVVGECHPHYCHDYDADRNTFASVSVHVPGYQSVKCHAEEKFTVKLLSPASAVDADETADGDGDEDSDTEAGDGQAKKNAKKKAKKTKKTGKKKAAQHQAPNKWITCPNIDPICKNSKPFECFYGSWNEKLKQCICSPGYISVLENEDESDNNNGGGARSRCTVENRKIELDIENHRSHSQHHKHKHDVDDVPHADDNGDGEDDDSGYQLDEKRQAARRLGDGDGDDDDGGGDADEDADDGGEEDRRRRRRALLLSHPHTSDDSISEKRNVTTNMTADAHTDADMHAHTRSNTKSKAPSSAASNYHFQILMAVAIIAISTVLTLVISVFWFNNAYVARDTS